MSQNPPESGPTVPPWDGPVIPIPPEPPPPLEPIPGLPDPTKFDPFKDPLPGPGDIPNHLEWKLDVLIIQAAKANWILGLINISINAGFLGVLVALAVMTALLKGMLGALMGILFVALFVLIRVVLPWVRHRHQ